MSLRGQYGQLQQNQQIAFRSNFNTFSGPGRSATDRKTELEYLFTCRALTPMSHVSQRIKKINTIQLRPGI